jgi:hypothetical protein
MPGAPDAGETPDGRVPIPGEHTFVRFDVPPIALAPGLETADQCFAYSLGNDEPLYVNRVSMTGTPGIHHSNWFFVSPGTYPGEDGLFRCSDRHFDTIRSATAGGVLFAQSTQNVNETQQFRPNTALAIPPGSVIVADLHLLNASPAEVTVDISLELEAIPESELVTRLIGFSFDYIPLVIPPHARSEFTATCDLALPHQRTLHRPLDFRIHHVLPHYHALGYMLRLEVVGGPRDGEAIWETRSLIGEPLGGAVDPPFDLTGATGIRLTCGFDNPTDETVGWGIGTQEMCIAFGFSDSPLMWAGSTSLMDNVVVGEVDGVIQNQTNDCFVLNAVPEGSPAP